ncbi:MAG: EamA family transporter RarD [Gammaproteobacteria bacterium]|nr:EamA family transporter RarD [Gammaproteobacteria bacterium]
MNSFRIGITSAVAAQLLWGLFPLYWKQVSHVPSLEVLSHRNLWCLVFLAAVVMISTNRRSTVSEALGSPRQWLIHGVAGVLIAINWGVYIYAVSVDRVVDASFGYFMSPLISVALGAIFYRERLSAWRMTAVAMAVAAVLILVLMAGVFPVIGLSLGFSFAIYGSLRKAASTGPISGLFVESLIIAPIALLYLAKLWQGDTLVLGQLDMRTDLLLVLGGVVTAVPLMLFGNGARRLPLSLSGMLVYITPVMQFLIGWRVYNEVIEPLTWLAFGLIWCALVLYTVDTQRQSTK